MLEHLGCHATARQVLQRGLLVPRLFQRPTDDFHFQFARDDQHAIDISKDDIARPYQDPVDFKLHVVRDHLPATALVLSIAAGAKDGKIEGQNPSRVTCEAGQHGAGRAAPPMAPVLMCTPLEFPGTLGRCDSPNSSQQLVNARSRLTDTRGTGDSRKSESFFY